MGRVNEDGSVTFGVPKGEIKDAYFDLILKQMYHLGMQITQPDPYSRGGIPIMVKYIISHIPRPEQRKELKESIEKELEVALEGIDDLEDRQRITIDTYIESMGNVSDYLENFMGIEKENRLGIIGGVFDDDEDDNEENETER